MRSWLKHTILFSFVHSSLCIRHLGFEMLSDPVSSNGLIYVPMRFDVLPCRILDKDNVRVFDFAENPATLSAVSGVWSCQMDRMISFISHMSAFVRIRAAMIMMALVKWTSPDNVLPYVLKLLHDEKPSAVRQCLELLSPFLKADPRCSDTVMSEVKNMDLSAYMDSMRPLITNNIAEIF